MFSLPGVCPIVTLAAFLPVQGWFVPSRLGPPSLPYTNNFCTYSRRVSSGPRKALAFTISSGNIPPDVFQDLISLLSYLNHLILS